MPPCNAQLVHDALHTVDRVHDLDLQQLHKVPGGKLVLPVQEL